MQWRADNAWAVRRSYYFPLVPIVHIDDRRSFKVSGYYDVVIYFSNDGVHYILFSLRFSVSGTEYLFS